MAKLLARYAEAFFWLGRYVERLESLARIIDVHESFNRDGRGEVDWRSLLQLYSDEAAFAARNQRFDRDTVIGYYLTDRDNPGSITACLRMARDNCRVLRPMLATSVWAQFTSFANLVNGLRAGDLEGGRLSNTCRRVIQLAQTHTGIMQASCYRDEGYYFYYLGVLLERADQTTRLLDVRQQALLRSDFAQPALQASQWNALLRSLDGYHAYRRVNPGELSRSSVARFLLLNGHFPRSVAYCLARTEDTMQTLRRDHGLRHTGVLLERLDAIGQALQPDTVGRRIDEELHGLNDWLQGRINDLGMAIAQQFFLYAPLNPETAQAPSPTPTAPVPGQSQSLGELRQSQR